MLGLPTEARLQHVVEILADVTPASLVHLDLMQVRCGVVKPFVEPRLGCQRDAPKPSGRAPSTVLVFA